MIANWEYWRGVICLLALAGTIGLALQLRGKRMAEKFARVKAAEARIDEERHVDRRYVRELSRQEAYSQIALACYKGCWTSPSDSAGKTTEGKDAGREHISAAGRDDTEDALDAALGATSSNGLRRARRKAKRSSGPKFRRPSQKELGDPTCKHFQVLEEKSHTCLKADRSPGSASRYGYFRLNSQSSTRSRKFGYRLPLPERAQLGCKLFLSPRFLLTKSRVHSQSLRPGLFVSPQVLRNQGRDASPAQSVETIAISRALATRASIECWPDGLSGTHAACGMRRASLPRSFVSCTATSRSTFVASDFHLTSHVTANWIRSTCHQTHSRLGRKCRGRGQIVMRTGSTTRGRVDARTPQTRRSRSLVRRASSSARFASSACW